MLRIIDGRDTGKTKKLLEECSRTGGLFVCAHPDRVFEKCRSYGFDYSKVIPSSYDDFLFRKTVMYDNMIYIDEIEKLINRLIKVVDNNDNKLGGYTLTVEDTNG